MSEGQNDTTEVRRNKNVKEKGVEVFEHFVFGYVVLPFLPCSPF
jgi:hypothetical protein